MDTAAKPQTSTQSALTNQQFAELQQRLRGSTVPHQGIAFTTTMLVGHVGWTPQQAANFIGVDEGWAEQCVQAYRDRGINGLLNLEAPAYRGQTQSQSSPH